MQESCFFFLLIFSSLTFGKIIYNIPCKTVKKLKKTKQQNTEEKDPLGWKRIYYTQKVTTHVQINDLKIECILDPRAYDPSDLRQESRALGATILK